MVDFNFRKVTVGRGGEEEEMMSYDDVEIEGMEWNEELKAYTYPCPCGDLFQITKEDLRLGEEIARCPSYSLYITVIYNIEDFSTQSGQRKIAYY
ncbi:Zinc finger, DPH-type [Trema orientale]|uniref:Diphthamide biosynthesis protein 3 n=1 Tax=Trema orientale TaxID=63057 RepID=A0A2P5EEW8_TREOI|nr:Zinc finger, DPH-type [Trema orientale]